jgi:hypothetical protein
VVTVIDPNVTAYSTFNFTLNEGEPAGAWASFGRMSFAARTLADGGWERRFLSNDPGYPTLTAAPGMTLIAVNASAARLFAVADGGVTTMLGPYPVPTNQLLSLVARPLGMGGAEMTQLMQLSGCCPSCRLARWPFGCSLRPQASSGGAALQRRLGWPHRHRAGWRALDPGATRREPRLLRVPAALTAAQS